MDALRADAGAFERSLDPARRKHLGQFHTPPSLARLLAALAWAGRPRTVLDPMAGQGELLDWAWAWGAQQGAPPAVVHGVEIDAATAARCADRLAAADRRYSAAGAAPAAVRVLAGDAFDARTVTALGGAPYDLVVANPPYVRYQRSGRRSHDRSAPHNGPGDDPPGAVPAIMPSAAPLERARVRAGLSDVVEAIAPAAERACWRALVEGYAGTADLSVPAWLLAAVLTRPGGVLALIVPAAWATRDYGRVLRYLMVRAFSEVCVIGADGTRWFPGALVDTVLVVARRVPITPATALTSHSAVHAAPPARRAALAPDGQTDDGVPAAFAGTWTRVHVGADAAGGDSVVGAAFPNSGPGGADRSFADWVRAPLLSGAWCPVGVTRIDTPRVDEARRVAADTAGARWRRAADEDDSDPSAGQRGRTRTRHPVPNNSPRPAAVPTVLLEWVRGVPDAVAPDAGAPSCGLGAAAGLFDPRVVESDEIGVRCGQGLRTGCNAFFYVDVIAAGAAETRVRTSPLFGSRELLVPNAVLRSVVRRQHDVAAMQVAPESLAGAVLVLRGWYLPEDPAAHLTLDLWADVDGPRVLPPALADYVRQAARTVYPAGDPPRLIPELSAVAPNAARPGGRWYMLPPFTGRHAPAVFLARVSAGTPRAAANADVPVLVDANFTGVWTEPARTGATVWPAPAVAAVLSSVWGRACIEAIGTPMGGGALKLEATHLARFPWPQLSADALAELGRWGEPAWSAPGVDNAVEAGPGGVENAARVDHLVLAGVLGETAVPEQIAAVRAALDAAATTLRDRRRRRPN